MTNYPRKRVFPLNPHPDHLRKEAKARLADMSARAPGARLADIQFILAREYGFPNWTALQAEVMRCATARKVRLFRRAWSVAVAPKHLMDQDAEEDHASFFRIGVAAQIGFIFVALVGVALVLVLQPLGMARLAQLIHNSH